MNPPPRPPKKAHLQNRKLSPASLRLHEENEAPVKYKPPAPDPDPSPPDLQATTEWIKQLTARSALDSSDSGCSSLGSTTHSPLNSGHQYPDLLIWSSNTTNNTKSKSETKSNDLIAQIQAKLQDFNAYKVGIEEAIRGNDSLGQGLTSLVETRASLREISKFKFHVEDTEKITNLLVSLSGRLARTEMAMSECSSDDMTSLMGKRDKLQDQLNEAKVLQENIDKRSEVVSDFLQKYFSPSEFADFQHFLQRKSKLIMDLRETSDKIALCEEQMRALTKKP